MKVFFGTSIEEIMICILGSTIGESAENGKIANLKEVVQGIHICVEHEQEKQRKKEEQSEARKAEQRAKQEKQKIKKKQKQEAADRRKYGRRCSGNKPLIQAKSNKVGGYR